MDIHEQGHNDSRSWQHVAHLDQLKNPGSIVVRRDTPPSVIIVRDHQILAAYINRCPHALIPLDDNHNDVLSLDQRTIQCAMHFAQFRLEDGYCIYGPCAGDRLKRIALRVENGLIEIDIHSRF